MKVLVTGAGALLGQGVIRALRASSLDVEIVAVDPSSLAAGLYWADSAHLVPMADDPEYLHQVEKILMVERPDALLVGTDVELPIFAAQRERLEAVYGTKVVVSSSEVVEVAADKWQTYLMLKAKGLGCPLSSLPGDEEELIERVGFPLVVKPRRGCRAQGVVRVEDRWELRRVLDLQRRGVVSPGGDVIIQECVGSDDDEYTAGALVFGGRCEASIVMGRHLRDGNTYRAFVEAFPVLNQAVRIVAEAVGSYGPLNIQFRRDREGIKVFEVNARFSGTTPLRASAGFNEVEMVLRHVLQGEPIRQPRIEAMTILRYWTETVLPAGKMLERAPELEVVDARS